MLLRTEQLTKDYGRFRALDSLDLEVRPGEVCGILGPNGSGKSTALRLLLGFMKPTAGRAAIAGHDCWHDSLHARQHVAYLPGELRLYENMTGRRLIDFLARLRQQPVNGDLDRLAKTFDIDINRPLAQLSSGMKRKVALLAVLAPRTPLVILDEPTNTLDPTMRDILLAQLRVARAQGQAVLFSSHVLTEVERVCDRVAILQQGRLVHVQAMAELREARCVRATFAGAVETMPELPGLRHYERNHADVTFEYTGPLRELLAWLGRHDVLDLKIEPLGSGASGSNTIMTRTLFLKLLRDYRISLIVVALLLFLFQLLWSLVAKRVSTEIPQALAPFGLNMDNIREIVFKGPGKIIQSLLGGETLRLERSMDVLSMAYVHPLTQTILCIWAIGRASGAIAGEIDRGTMELLLAQPLRRSQVIVAHLAIDVVAIPVLCLAMWAGTCVGASLVGFSATHTDPNLRVELVRFGPALFNVALLVFAASGITMAISAAGRIRGKVMGSAVLLTLVMFLVNVIGQLWGPMEPLRPYTIFYWYEPQPLILQSNWAEQGVVWARLGVLALTGSAGYALAFWVFCRRDLPAPL